MLSSSKVSSDIIIMSLTVTGGPEVKINDKAPEQAIDADQIAKWASELNNDQSFLCIKDAAFKHGTQALSVNQAAARAHDHAFSNKIPNEGKATSQKSSGRCWIFAALNTLRIPFAKAQSVQLDGFEFSQNYVFFWDKFEKCNYVLEVLIETVDKEDAEGMFLCTCVPSVFLCLFRCLLMHGLFDSLPPFSMVL